MRITYVIAALALGPVGGDHGGAAAEVVVRAVQLIGLLHYEEEADGADYGAEDVHEAGEGLVQGVVQDNVIGKHIDQKTEEAWEGMHDTEAETRGDGEDDFCYELIEEES